MKKIILFLICASLLSSCTLEQVFLLPVPTSTPSITPSAVPTEIPSLTPTVPTPTFTSTPTLVGTIPPSPTLMDTPTPLILTPFNLVTPNTPAGEDMKGFVSVFASDANFYKEEPCKPTTVKITATVSEPIQTVYVLLFVRFKSKLTGTKSEWTRLDMSMLVAGTYVYDLKGSDMKAVDSFENAWVEYQIVNTDINAKEIARTPIFSEKLTLLECVLTPTPTARPTATVLKP
ncbi:MAG: hypothetical protein U0Z26_20025 [Anaerolineales bacterium]